MKNNRVDPIRTQDDIPSDFDDRSRKEYEKLVEDIQELAYSPFFKERGFATIQAQVAQNPFLARSLLHFNNYLIHEMELTQDAYLKELISQVVMLRKKSSSLSFNHWELSAKSGLGPEKLWALNFIDGDEGPGDVLSEDDCFIVRFVDATLGGHVSDELFEQARDRFGDRGTVELVVFIAFMGMWCTISNVLLPSHNYVGMNH